MFSSGSGSCRPLLSFPLLANLPIKMLPPGLVVAPEPLQENRSGGCSGQADHSGEEGNLTQATMQRKNYSPALKLNGKNIWNTLNWAESFDFNYPMFTIRSVKGLCNRQIMTDPPVQGLPTSEVEEVFLSRPIPWGRPTSQDSSILLSPYWSSWRQWQCQSSSRSSRLSL